MVFPCQQNWRKDHFLNEIWLGGLGYDSGTRMRQGKLGIEAERAKTNTPAQRLSWGVVWGEPGDDLLSHGNPHYHRRGVVSRSCSGWEGVVPTRYGHQAMTCCHVDGVNATNMGM